MTILIVGIFLFIIAYVCIINFLIGTSTGYSIEALHAVPINFDSVEQPRDLPLDYIEKAILLAGKCKKDSDYDRLEKKLHDLALKGDSLTSKKAIEKNELNQSMYEYAIGLAREVLSDIEAYETVQINLSGKLLYEGDKKTRKVLIFKILRDRLDPSDLESELYLDNYFIYAYDFSKKDLRKFGAAEIQSMYIKSEGQEVYINNIEEELSKYFIKK